MVEFGFTEAQEMYRTSIATFCKRELAAGAKQRAKLDSIPKEMIQKLAKHGLLSLGAPPEYGGEWMDWVSFGIVMEEISKVDWPLAMLVWHSKENFLLLDHCPDQELRKIYYPGLCSGEKAICHGVTEPGCGSDVSAMITKARLEGDYYILNGEKTSVTRCMDSDMAEIHARTGPERVRGITRFFVPFDFPGVSRSKFNDMGWMPLNRGSIFLDDVRIPKSYIINTEGEGFYEFLKGGDRARVLLALMCMGLAQAAVNDAMQYAKDRQAFGRPIAKFEGVQFPLAEAQTLIDAGRLLAYRALWMDDQGMRHTKESSMAKWFCPKMAVEIIHNCLLTLGHYGYCDEHPMEQRLREAIGFEIGDGTAQIQKTIIAREMLGKEYLPYRGTPPGQGG